MEDQASWFSFMYKNKAHDDYAHDALWCVMIIFAFCCATAYLKIITNARTIRDEWSKYQCNPAYLPFAGLIMKPNDSLQDQMKFTNANLQQCVQTELKSISSKFTNPLYYVQSVAMSTLHGIANALNAVRILINRIRDALSSIIADVMGRVLNVMQPVVTIVINARDMMGKIQGIMTASLYTLYSTYASIQTGLRSVFQIIVIILIAMGAAIVVLWIAVAIAIAFGPFGIPFVISSTAAAVVLTAIYIGIAIPMGIIAHFLAQTMRIQGLSLIPSPPRG
jgi:hypothetical protein